MTQRSDKPAKSIADGKAVSGSDRAPALSVPGSESTPEPETAPLTESEAFALYSPEMVDALSPDEIRRKIADGPDDWADAVAAIGCPGLTPPQSPGLVFNLLMTPFAERAALARLYPAELFTILCVAAEWYDMTEPQMMEVARAFPGVTITFQESLAKHGRAEMAAALGVTL